MSAETTKPTIWSALQVMPKDFNDFALRRATSEYKRYGRLSLVLDTAGVLAIVTDYKNGHPRQSIDDCGATSLHPIDLRRDSHAWLCYGRRIEPATISR